MARWALLASEELESAAEPLCELCVEASQLKLPVTCRSSVGRLDVFSDDLCLLFRAGKFTAVGLCQPSYDLCKLPLFTGNIILDGLGG